MMDQDSFQPSRFPIVGCLLCLLTTLCAHTADAAPKTESVKTKTQVDHAVAGSVSRIQSLGAAKKPREQKEVDAELERLFPTFRITEKGDSGRSLLNQACRSLDVNRVPADKRSTLQTVMDDVTLYRKLPTIQFEVDQQAYQYLLNHPDVAVSIWRALEISKVDVRQIGKDTYHCDGGDGTLAKLEFLSRGQQEQIVHCEGEFANPFWGKPIRSSSILRIQQSFQQQANGRTLVVHEAEVFIAFPSRPTETAARMFSPIGNIIADRNFRELSLFVHTMSKAMVLQPQWVESIAGELQGVDRKRPQELVDLTRAVHVRAVMTGM